MTRRALWSSLFIALLLMPLRLSANCGSATCPLNNYRYLKSGSLRLSLTREYINLDQIFVGSDRSFVGALPNTHDEVSTLNERSVYGLNLGVADWLTLTAELPVVHREHLHIQHDSAGPKYESWQFDGLGDATLSAHIAVLVPSDADGPLASVMLGVKLPSGITGVRNADGEAAEVTLQPGTGSTDLLLGAQFRQAIGTVPALHGLSSTLPIEIGISYQVPGTGTSGYRFSNTLVMNVGTAYQLGRHASLLLQTNYRNLQHADVGTTGEFASNTGGTWLYVTPGFNVQLNDILAAHAFVQLPVYQHVNGIQQTSKFNLQFGISALVGLTD